MTYSVECFRPSKSAGSASGRIGRQRNRGPAAGQARSRSVEVHMASEREILGPADGRQVPRFAGPDTFARLPRLQDLNGATADVVPRCTLCCRLPRSWLTSTRTITPIATRMVRSETGGSA